MTASATDRVRGRRRGPTLADVGEFGLLSRIRDLRRPGRGVEVGIGDDCAVVRVDGGRWLLTTDALVEGVHFERAWDDAAGRGRRAFEVNASDVAAMGGVPRYALLSLSVPGDCEAAEVEATIRGVAAAARAAGCSLVGGNLTAAPVWTISVTLIGECTGAPLLRSGARPGDAVYVSGSLGGAAFEREILLGLRRGPRPATRPFLRPRARVAIGRWLATTGSVTAAIDVSDGLLADLGHVCEESGVGAVIDAALLPLARSMRRLPRAERLALALRGGEDYELLFTVKRDRAPRLEAAARRRGVPIRRIGTIIAARGVRVEGVDVFGAARGHDHFRR